MTRWIGLHSATRRRLYGVATAAWFDDHEHTTQCVGVIIPKAYDGVLFWSCSDGELRNRWSSMYHIHKIAEKEMERWRAKSTH